MSKNIKVRCIDCANFTPDEIGSGLGIGSCPNESYKSPYGIGLNMPLFPMVVRKCYMFKNKKEGIKDVKS